MTTAEKLAKIDAFERGAAAFDDTLDLTQEALRFRPFPDAWTIHEQVAHFLESDLAAYHRYRRAVAEPGTKVLGFDEGVWTPALEYHTHDLGAAIGLLKALRSYAAAHLRAIADRDWSVYVYDSSLWRCFAGNRGFSRNPTLFAALACGKIPTSAYIVLIVLIASIMLSL